MIGSLFQHQKPESSKGVKTFIKRDFGSQFSIESTNKGHAIGMINRLGGGAEGRPYFLNPIVIRQVSPPGGVHSRSHIES